MSHPEDLEGLHQTHLSFLSKEDTSPSFRTSFLGQGHCSSFLSDDQFLPRHIHTCEEDDHAHTKDDDDVALADMFSVPSKHLPIPAYQQWKKVTLVLIASHRFRHPTGLKECGKPLHSLCTTTHAVCAGHCFHQSIINEGSRSKASSLESDSSDNVPEASLQCFDAPKTELSTSQGEIYPCFSIPSNGHVSSVDSLPHRMASLLQDRNPHTLEEFGGVEGVACVLEASLENGLKGDEQYFQERRDKFGANTYPEQPSKPFYSSVCDACKDPTLTILMVCALLSLGFGIKNHGIEGGWYDGTSIAFAVMLVVLVTSVSDYRQSLEFLNLSKEKRSIPVYVIRGGRKMQVAIFDLVVGDLVSLSIGDQVPADGLLVDGHSLILDESTMTGESEPLHIDRKMPYLLSGCKVVDGYGTMLVTGVGTRTEWGLLMAELGKDSDEETPLQVRLNGVATFVGQIGLSISVLVLIFLLVFYFAGHKEGTYNTGKFRLHHTPASTIMSNIVDIVAITITMMILAVPEGLPLAVSLSLAYAMKKMMADRALVRRLAACETMGSATTICTDKTGTLTSNIMTVVKVCVGSDELRDAEDLPHISSNLKSLLLEGIAQNSSAHVFVPPEGGEPEVMGSPTEKAVIMWGLTMGMKCNEVRSFSKILQVETFNPINKRAGVAVKIVNSGEVRAHWKGAAEIVLGECNAMMTADDSILPMTAVKKTELMNVIEGMASHSLRCIAFAYKEVPVEEVPRGEQSNTWKIPQGPLTLIAIVGIKNSCRHSVQEAVRKCQAAGIKVRMLTGDNIVTAKAIATECGILEQGGIALEGCTFRNFSDEERRNQLPNISVMACSLPSDKLLMVRTLRAMGEVVAVTGDSIHDAPALHEADIGLAMGIQGTEVAKQSSDVIVLDDDFATLVKVVHWGRSIHANIQKFIQFQLTVNVAALTINFVAAASSGGVPLTPVHLLWVNLIMDTLGALALATEPPTHELLERPPVSQKEPLITNIMVRNLLFQAAYQIILFLTLRFRGKKLLRLHGREATDINNTVIFNAFVLCQLFNELNARKPEKLNIFKGIFQHGLFMGIIAGTLVLQVILVEFLNKLSSTVKLSWALWMVCVTIGFISWPIALVAKFIPIPKKESLCSKLRW